MKKIKLLTLISLSGQVIFIAAVILMHFLRPDKNPVVDFVSEYAVGNYGWLMTFAFFSNAVGQACLFAVLLFVFKPSRISLFTFAIWCLGTFLFSIFKTDLPGQPPTFTGLVLHGIAALIAFVFLAISMMAWANVFKRNENWAKLTKISNFFGGTSIILFFVFLFSPVWLRGFTERILIGWDFGWLLLITTHLLRLKS